MGLYGVLFLKDKNPLSLIWAHDNITLYGGSKMKRKIKFAISMLMLLQVSFASAAFAEPYGAPEKISNRFELILFSGYSASTTSYRISKLPVVVLDTVMGVVWRCDNIEDSNPRWVKTDLGKNEGKPLTARKYIAQISFSPVSGNKIPAVVLDTEQGKIWTCPNILDEGSPWVQRDLVKEIKEERKAAPARY